MIGLIGLIGWVAHCQVARHSRHKARGITRVFAQAVVEFFVVQQVVRHHLPLALCALTLAGIKQHLVLAAHRVAADQGFAVRNEVAQAHAFAPGQARGLGHVATQGDGVAQLGADGQHGEQVAVFQGGLEALLVQGKVLHAARLAAAGGEALERHTAGVCHHRQATGHGQQLVEGLVGRFQLVHRRVVDLAHHGHIAQGGWDDDDVAVGQLDVARAVATCQKAVEVKLGHHLSCALELHAAHRATGIGPAGGQQAAGQARHTAERVAARATRLAHHIHRDGTQLAQGDAELKVFVKLADRCAQDAFGLRGFDTGQRHTAHAGQADHAVAVDHGAHVHIERAPTADEHLVARA